MKTTTNLKTNGNEQEALNGVVVRLIIGKDEQERFNRLLIEHHYLHSADMFQAIMLCGGQQLCGSLDYAPIK